MDIEEHKKIFRDFFLEKTNEQFLIRSEMIGHHILSVYYTSKLEAWDFDIKDESVIHVPTGILTIKLSNGNYYQLNTNYQDLSGGSYGILIDKIEEKSFLRQKFDLDTDYFSELKRWDKFKKISIDSIKWKWNAKGKIYKRGTVLALKKITEDFIYNFVPESLVLKFDNNETIHILALEPDAEIPDKETYTLLSCGEEFMIFLDENKLEKWDLSNLGFEIQTNVS
jgi:hypothetical protein